MHKVSLSNIANIIMGTSPAGEFCGVHIDGVPLLNGPAEFTDFYPIPVQFTSDAKRLSEAGDILFCVRGSTTGRMNWSDKKYAIGRGLAAISHKAGSEYNHFLRYLLETNLSSLLNNTNGSTFPNLTSNLLANFSLTVPELDSQKKISVLLRYIDNKIELNNRINAELEAMAKTLYDYWFVQFDFPISKEQAAAMGKPELEGKPYKTSGGKMAYNPILKREIPEGWKALPLSKYLDCNKKKLGKKHNLKTINYLDTANLTNNIVGSIQKLDVGIDNIPSRANMIVSKNDILYSTVRPNQFHYGIIKDPIENMIASTGFAVLTHKTNSELNVIFYLHIISPKNTTRLIKISESSKSSYPSISPDDILNLTIALPSESTLLKRFSELINPLFEKISEVQKENKELEKLRDWLLPMLMNGQVTVK